MLTTTQSLLMVVVVAVCTFFTRLLPFLLFRGGRKMPAWAVYLGRILPAAIMATLVIYCLKGVRPLAYPYGLPELIAIALVVMLHVWKRNTLLSIGGGTLLYMLLVQVVF